MGAIIEAQPSTREANFAYGESGRFRIVRISFWLLASAIGSLQIWLSDRNIWADTLSYLDSGDMLWRGDFKNAITPHWSPGYPFLLGFLVKVLHPVGLWEVAVVKLADLITLLFAIGCFDFFVSRFCRYHDRKVRSQFSKEELAVPQVALAATAYLLFIWTITNLLIAWFSTPDMLVMGIIFLIFGLLLDIEWGATGYPTFAVLGLALGFGFLAKAPLFPLGFMFIGIAYLLVRDRQRAIPRTLLSLGLFILISSPLVIRLSEAAGHLTFGTSGAWNYARTVNGIAFPYHWRGRPAGSGTPLHPTRVIFQAPTVYEFGSPVLGTYPPWRDPYYWFAGITPHFDLHGQWRVLKENIKILEEEASGLDQAFLFGFLILFCMSSDRRLVGKVVAKQWFLLVPCLATLAMFSVVLVQDRYIAPYPIVIGLILFSGVAMISSRDSRRLVNATVLLTAVFFAASSLKPASIQLRYFAQTLRRHEILGRGGSWHTATQAVSDALKTHGLQSGSKVAYIGESHDFYWARVAGVQVNAEIRQWDLTNSFYDLVPRSTVTGIEPSVDVYWASSPQVKARIDCTLYGAGSKAIVTDDFPKDGSSDRWDPVPETPFHIHLLSPCSQSVNQ